MLWFAQRLYRREVGSIPTLDVQNKKSGRSDINPIARFLA